MSWGALAAAAAAHAARDRANPVRVVGRVGWYCERCHVTWSASQEEPCWCCGLHDARITYAEYVRQKWEAEQRP